MRYSEIIENMDHDKDGRAVEELRAALEAHKDKLQDATDDQVYDIIDKIMTRIAKSHSISGQKLHDMWVDKYKQIPDTWIMNEAFDQPYKGKWEKSDYGDVDLNTKLPDGTYLNIMFNQEYGDEGEEVTQVEFHRNNSQDVTGEGDAQRIFATVLDAIQKYIKKYKPQKLSFSASKSVDMDADDNGAKFNPESRAKLYDRLVQRYSKAWGYRAFRADNGDIVIYELSRVKPVTEDQINELGNAPAEYTANRKRKNSLFHATVEGHWVDVFFDRSEFNGTLHITFTVNGNYDTPSMPTSASKSTVKILSTVLNVVKQKLPEYIKKSRPPGVSFTAKEDNRAGLYRKYFVPVIQDILGAKWQHEEYPNMGMTVFHWKPVAKSKPVTEDQDYMAGHCHVMAIALKMLHPDWQIRAHVGWEDDTAEDDEYRVDHVYTVAPDGSAYDCRGRFDSEEALVGNDASDGFETQYVDFDLADIEQLVRRGELKRFTRQDIDHAMRFAKQIGQQGVAENFHDGRNPQDKGDSKRHGVPTHASISTLRKVAKQGGRKGQLAHWMANMKSGRAKAKRK
jgi:hypothetical protein